MWKKLIDKVYKEWRFSLRRIDVFEEENIKVGIEMELNINSLLY